MNTVTLADFFTKPTIIADDRSAPLLRDRPSLKSVDGVAFLQEFTVKINEQGGSVYKGSELVASIGKLSDLVVKSSYRGRGIATALIVAWYNANKDFKPLAIPVRTTNGAKAYTKAWATIGS